VSTLALDISISLDGYVTARMPAMPRRWEPMGIGGERLRAWAFGDDPTSAVTTNVHRVTQPS
jgi:hypothetical protein